MTFESTSSRVKKKHPTLSELEIYIYITSIAAAVCIGCIQVRATSHRRTSIGARARPSGISLSGVLSVAMSNLAAAEGYRRARALFFFFLTAKATAASSRYNSPRRAEKDSSNGPQGAFRRRCVCIYTRACSRHERYSLVLIIGSLALIICGFFSLSAGLLLGIARRESLRER